MARQCKRFDPREKRMKPGARSYKALGNVELKNWPL